MKLWLNEHNFIELSERESLTEEIAARSRSLDWMGIYALLPDPDPVLRKTGQDITVYRQTLADAHVWSCYQSRKSGTLSCEWRVNEAKDGPVRQNRIAYELIKDMMDKIDVYQVITDMLEAPFFGMAPIEVVWGSTKSSWLPKRIEGKPPEWFAFDTENHLRFLSRDNMIEGEEIPDYKFLLPRHHASYQNPYGERALSRCFWPVVFKKGGFKFWAIFAEKYGMPWVVGKVPGKTNDTERERLLTNLAKMVQDAVAVINNDESIEITEAAGKSASAHIYEKLISAGNREISKAILGQTLTTEMDKGGSYAATKGHMEVRADLVDQDKRMVCQAFNTLFSWVVKLNFQGATAPEFVFYEEEDIHKDVAERDERLTKQGVRFSRKYYVRTYNLREDDIDAVVLPQAPGNFAEAANRDDNRFSQTDVDQLTGQAAKRAQDGASRLLKPIENLVSRAESFEEIGSALYDLYPEMDASQFQDLLARAMFASGLIGYGAAKDDEK